MYMSRTNLRPIAIFISTAFIGAFLLDIGAAQLTSPSMLTQGYFLPLVLFAWGVARMYVVALATLLAVRSHGAPIFSTIRNYLKISGRSMLFFLAAPLLVYMTIGIYILLLMLMQALDISALLELFNIPALSIEPTTLLIVSLAAAYLAGISVNSIAAFGEEIGWRGYLLDVLGQSVGFWRATLLIGVVWGLWHASAILLLGYNNPCKCIEGVAAFTLFTAALGIPHAVLTRHVGTIMPAISLHGTLNAVWNTTVIITKLPVELGASGVLGAAAWALTSSAIVMFLHLERKQRHDRANYYR